MDTVKFIFHLFAFAVSAFATHYELFVLNIPGREERRFGQFKFLTFWNMCFQTVYFGFNLISDVVEKKANPVNPAQRGTLQRWRDIFHSTIVFPTTLFVCVSFWVIYAVDRELVFPKALDKFFPVWLNQVVHTTILPFIVIDKLVCHHHYPKRSYGIMGCGFLAVLYLAWVFRIAYLDNFWVYPILEVLGGFHRAAFLSVCVTFFASFYIVFILLSRVFLIAYLDNFWVYLILEVLGGFHRAAFLSVCVAFFASFYIVFILLSRVFLIAYLDNFWVYPILEVLGGFHRAAFLSVCVAFFASFYIVGESLTTFIWGKGLVTSAKPQGKKKKSSNKAK